MLTMFLLLVRGRLPNRAVAAQVPGIHHKKQGAFTKAPSDSVSGGRSGQVRIGRNRFGLPPEVR